MSAGLLVGIDLGTTNTACSIIDTDASPEPVRIPIHQLVRDPHGHDPYGESLTLPSVVWIADDRNVHAGLYCKAAAGEIESGVLVRDIKREMGNPVWSVQGGNRRLRPRHISAILLWVVKESIHRKYPGREFDRVVVTIPASFSSLMRQETVRAAAIAGFDRTRVELLDEPVAAALSEIAEPWLDKADDTPIFVFDMGGGTLDSSVIRISRSSQKIEVIATSRYHDFAGADIDLEFGALLLQQTRVHPEYEGFLEVPELPDARLSRRIGHAIIFAGERAKLALSQVLDRRTAMGGVAAKRAHYERSGDLVEIDWTLDFADSARPRSVRLPVADLIRCIEPFVIDGNGTDRNIFTPIHQALRRAEVQRPESVLVALAGGSSYLPLIKDAVSAFFHQTPLLLDPVHAVADGAAIWARLKNTKDWTITETLRDGLFLKRKGQIFIEVFGHPTPIPSPTQTRRFDGDEAPYFPIDRHLRFEFFQGDSPHDPLLSLCHIENIALPQQPAGDLKLSAVSASVDTNKVFGFHMVLADGVREYDRSFSVEPVPGEQDGSDSPRELRGLHIHEDAL
jgi:molecular chaperone DnaK (HSP70)